MVEAVSVASSNAPIVRSNAEVVDVARTSAISPAKVEASASLPQAPYVSPYIYVDQNFHKAVTQIRDPSTGHVIGQFPSEQTLNLRHAQAEHITEQQAPQRPAPVVTSAAPVAAPAISTAVIAPQANTAPPPPVQAQAASDALSTAANGGGSQSKTVNITA